MQVRAVTGPGSHFVKDYKQIKKYFTFIISMPMKSRSFFTFTLGPGITIDFKSSEFLENKDVTELP